jgi:bacteriorhodopsin
MDFGTIVLIWVIGAFGYLLAGLFMCKTVNEIIAEKRINISRTFRILFKLFVLVLWPVYLGIGLLLRAWEIITE